MKKLRDHQVKAIEMLRTSLRQGKRRPLLEIATGGGKTVVASEIIRSAREKGNRVLFIVDAIELIDQTVRVFYDQGLYGIGVIQADHTMTDYSKPIQIASIQTLQRRKMIDTDLVIIDEAHGQHKFLSNLMASEEWSKVPFIGLSATPWTKGLGNIFDDLILPVTMRELIDLGFLCPFRVFAPSHPDLRGVKVTAGDYQEDDLAKVMGDDVLLADIVETWRNRATGRPTLCFCVNRTHAQSMKERFEQAGVPCGYIDANTPIAERRDIRRKLDAGEIKVVCNIGCLTKGVDWAIGCIVLARPTKSASLAVQMIGRGLRVNPELPHEDCLILDHSDTILRLGFPTDMRREELCTAKKGEACAVEQKPKALPKECKVCHYVMPAGVKICPACGAARPVLDPVAEGKGELIELHGGRQLELKAKPKPEDKRRFYAELLTLQKVHGKGPHWADGMFKQKFGHWPANKQVLPCPVSDHTSRWVKSRQIAYAKSRSAA